MPINPQGVSNTLLNCVSISWKDLLQEGIVEGFDNEDGDQNEEALTNKGVAVLDRNSGANLTAHQIGASHE